MCITIQRKAVKLKLMGETTMAVTKKSLISSKPAKKSTTKTKASNPASKLVATKLINAQMINAKMINAKIV